MHKENPKWVIFCVVVTCGLFFLSEPDAAVSGSVQEREEEPGSSVSSTASRPVSHACFLESCSQPLSQGNGSLLFTVGFMFFALVWLGLI